jgi:hypothetical protein
MQRGLSCRTEPGLHVGNLVEWPDVELLMFVPSSIILLTKADVWSSTRLFIKPLALHKQPAPGLRRVDE